MRAHIRTLTGITLAVILVVAELLAGGQSRVSAQQTELQQGKVPAKLLQAPDGDKVTYWIILSERADLKGASKMPHDARGRFVVDQLRGVAERSQAGLRALLRARGADFDAFWAANLVKVTSDKATMLIVARRPEVEKIETDRIYTIPDPSAGIQQATIQSIEWNIANIRANEAWGTFGARGQGIVVGSIDTGAQFDHPALVNQYRGNRGGGVFDHNYNWYDPSLICGNPSIVPCDNQNHGTHTMGTIVGDDGGANQIGVAPGARWMTAKGCENRSCTAHALISSGQWMLAPTDLNGQNPRPDLRPDVISNSWGGGGSDPFFQQIVQSWVAAGIFPVFANGNDGPGCGTVASPGDYPESYGVGAYDSSNVIAEFSSRGPSLAGLVKPNISAPGVNVRSSIPGSIYAAFSGTSMATPHVAGVVALMWSAAPPLIGDVAWTRSILDQTAIDTPDSSCGGTAANNSVYGEGRLDAYAAVDLSPRGPTGTMQGIVSDARTGAAVSGAQVRAVGPSNRMTVTSTDGAYMFMMPTGSYDVTVAGFGYLPQTASAVWIAENTITVQNFALTPGPSAALSGVVRDAKNAPIANARVTVLDTPIAPVTTDANGVYRFASVPLGTYQVAAEFGKCTVPVAQTVALTVDQTLDFQLFTRFDPYGYACSFVPQTWIDGTDLLGLTGDDAYRAVTLPFAFPFYGTSYATANVSTNGFLNFTTPNVGYNNTAIPTPYEPNGAIYPLWDDLVLDASSVVRTGTVGVSPNRRFVVEWLNASFYGEPDARLDFEVVLGENGEILTQYRNVSSASGREQGRSATIGIENATGTMAFMYAANEAVIADGMSIRYAITPFTGVTGTITDANDGLAAATTATVRALLNGIEVARASTDPNGYYYFHFSTPGTYTIEASASKYETGSAVVVVSEDVTSRQNFALRTALVTITPTSMNFTMYIGRTAQQTLTIANTGSSTANWTITEYAGHASWLSLSATAGTLAPGATSAVQVTVNAAGLAPGPYSAPLIVDSNSARVGPAVFPLNIRVFPYDQGVNAGGRTDYYNTGVTWATDKPFIAGGWGFTNPKSSTDLTRKTIAGTADVGLFQTQRVSPVEYRFDNLVAGTYQVTVGFAEFRNVRPGARVVDIIAEGVTVLPGHDVLAHVAGFTADVHTFTIAVNDGQLNLQFVPRPGSQAAIVNAIRVLQLQ